MATNLIRRVLALALLAVPLAAAPAWADAIDGDWCFSDGRRMSIDGPKIVTPGGKATTGDYDRHAFSYTVPNGEPGSGSVISMTLIDDDTLHLRPGKATLEVWRRCRKPGA